MKHNRLFFRQFFKGLAIFGLSVGSLVVVAPYSAQNSSSVWDGVYSLEQARRGELLYQDACGDCHGANLQGIELAPALAQGDFIWNYDGMPLATLFKRIRESMPLGNPDALGRTDKADILAYILQQNQFPEGDTELPSRNSGLNVITWIAADPGGQRD